MRKPLCSGKSGTSSDNKTIDTERSFTEMLRLLFTYRETKDERDKKKRYLLCGTRSRRRERAGWPSPRLDPSKRYGEKAQQSIVLLEQIRTIDKSRLTEFVGSLDRQTMGSVDRAIVVSFGIQYLEALIK